MSAINGMGAAGGIQNIIALRQQIIDRSQALQQVHAPAPATETSASSGPAGGFSDALKSALEGVNATQKNSEQLTTAFEKGEVTDVAKVMLARQESSIAFEATLQVRNRLLSAYQDIMRMGV